LRCRAAMSDRAAYPLHSLASTEEERRLATEAIEWLRSKRDPETEQVTEPKPAPIKPKRKR
jgi:hypothetical protein